MFGNATEAEQLPASLEELSLFSLVRRFVSTALVVTFQMKYKGDCEC
jgi:hypothetical protein